MVATRNRLLAGALLLALAAALWLAREGRTPAGTSLPGGASGEATASVPSHATEPAQVQEGARRADTHPTEPAPAPRRPAFRGRVSAPYGIPIPGAHVRLLRGQRVLGEARTAEDGRFEIPHAAREARLVVEAEGYVAARVRSAARDREHDIQLRRAVALRGRVLDAESGAPIVDALVRCQRQSARTGAAGDWHHAGFPGEPGGSTIELELPATLVELRVDLVEEGYARRLLEPVQVPAGGQRTLDVALHREVSAVLRLSPRGASEPPLRGDHAFFLLDPADRDGVELGAPGDHPPRGWSFGGVRVRLADPVLGERSVPFDRSGRARVRGLGPGEYVLRCVPDDLVLDPERITLPADGDTPIAVRWSRR